MDQALSSSRERDRRDYSSGGGAPAAYGPPRRGGRGGGRGGRWHSHHRHHNNNDYRRDHRRAPYDRRSGGGGRHGGGGGGGGGGNRFFAEPPLSNDPTAVAHRQMTAMMVRLGHVEETQQAALKLQAEQAPDQDMATEQPDNGEAEEETTTSTASPPTTTSTAITWTDRVRTQRHNIQSLTAVIAKKPNIFLTFQTQAVLQMMQQQQQSATTSHDSPHPHKNSTSTAILTSDALAGPWATAVGHCVSGRIAGAAWAIPTYAALVQTLDAAVSTSTDAAAYAGVAQRVVTWTVQQFAADLDLVLLVPSSSPSTTRRDHVTAQQMATRRAAAILQFWCALAAAGVLRISSDSPDNEDDQDPVPTAVQEYPLTVMGLIRALAMASTLQTSTTTTTTSSSTTSSNMGWVWEALLRPLQPAVQALLAISSSSSSNEVDTTWWEEHVNDALQEAASNSGIVTGTTSASFSSSSAFTPGKGPKALLLPTEQQTNDDDDELEEDDSDEEEDGDTPQMSDSWQALTSALSNVVSSSSQDSLTSSMVYKLWHEGPWSTDTPVSDGDEEGDAENKATGSAKLRLALYPTCQSLTLLLGGHLQAANPDPDQPLLQSSSIAVPWDDQSIVVGRLPIFGSPTESDLVQDDDEDEEDEGPVHPRLQSYRQNYAALDRVYLAESIRDLLVSHQVLVTKTGVAKGTLKAVAEQIWALRYVHDSPGMEYLMVQTLLALVCQVPPHGLFLGHSIVSLSRVLVELTRLDPALFSNVLAQAVHRLVEDYMPALTPIARDNLSQWFALHLVAFQYQWPAQYWQHWQTFAQKGWTSPRGAFVRRTIQLVLENSSTPATLLRQNPSWQSALSPISGNQEEDGLSSLLTEVANRIHQVNEDPTLLLQYLCSDEVAEAHAVANSSASWWRTRIVSQALVFPLAKEYKDLVDSFDNPSGGEDMQEDGPVEDEDVLATSLETVTRYESLLVGALKADAPEGCESTEGQSVLLPSVYEQTNFSPSCVEAIFHAFYDMKLVSSMGIVQWAVDSGPVLRWWEFVGMAMRWVMASVSSNSSDDSAMDELVDDTRSGLQMKATKIVGVLQPILNCVMTRIVKLLEQDTAASPSSKKPSSTQVDAIEGTKYVICLAHMLFLDHLWESWKDANGPDPMKEMREALDHSTIGKEALSELLSLSTDGSAEKSVSLLRDLVLNL